LLDDAVAFIEDVLLDQQAGEGVADGAVGGDMEGAPAGGAKYGLRSVGCATSVAKEGG